MFNVYDNDACRDKIFEFQSSAVSSYERWQDKEARFEQSYQDILDKQAAYGVELTNNRAFADWTTHELDLPEVETEDGEPLPPLKPAFNEQMKKFFGDPYDTRAPTAPPLRTIDQVEDAIYTLYWYRVEWQLEWPIMYRRRELMPMYIDPAEYSICSENTQVLAEILTNYMTYLCCDERAINYYPMLDNLVQWMDDTYGA